MTAAETLVGTALHVLLARAKASGHKTPAIDYRGLHFALKPDGSVRVTSRGSIVANLGADGALQLVAGVDWDAAVISQLSHDPVATCREEGRRSGVCCFCNRALTTPESCTAGYGPVCAERWGLPWGHVHPCPDSQPGLFGEVGF